MIESEMMDEVRKQLTQMGQHLKTAYSFQDELNEYSGYVQGSLDEALQIFNDVSEKLEISTEERSLI